MTELHAVPCLAALVRMPKHQKRDMTKEKYRESHSRASCRNPDLRARLRIVRVCPRARPRPSLNGGAP